MKKDFKFSDEFIVRENFSHYIKQKLVDVDSDEEEDDQTLSQSGVSSFGLENLEYFKEWVFELMRKFK